MRMNFYEIRDALIEEMIDQGEIIRKGDDIFEDMGDHLIHYSQLDGHIKSWLDSMRPEERDELIMRIGRRS